MRFRSLFSTALMAAMAFAACGEDANRPALTTEPGADGGTGTVKKDGGTGGDNPQFGDGGGDTGVVGGGELPNQCAADTQQAEQIPLDLYLMIDSSGSMADKTQAGTTKWDDTKAALGAFVDDPASAGIGVGVEFFPSVNNAVPIDCSNDGQCGVGGPCWGNRGCPPNAQGLINFCSTDADCGGTAGSCKDVGECLLLGGACFDDNDCIAFDTCAKRKGYCKGRDSCTVADYASPSANIAALPAAAGNIKSLLGARQVQGLTPTSPALGGAIEGAKTYKGANPTHAVAVVLVTDGFPTECAPTDIASIANTAQSGANAGIKTFVIGVFSPAEETEAKTNLNQIASKGGSGSAFVITTGQNVSQAFLQALSTIRGAALPCEYKLPVPAQGTPDYSKVNVQYTDGNGQKTTIFYVAGASSCDPTSGGWYYDVDPSQGKPTKVMICPKTCEGFKADSSAKVDIVQGCETVKVK